MLVTFFDVLEVDWLAPKGNGNQGVIGTTLDLQCSECAFPPFCDDNVSRILARHTCALQILANYSNSSSPGYFEALLVTYALQVCFTNQEFVVPICSKKCYFPLKMMQFLKGNGIFYYNLGRQIPYSWSTLVDHYTAKRVSAHRMNQRNVSECNVIQKCKVHILSSWPQPKQIAMRQWQAMHVSHKLDKHQSDKMCSRPTQHKQRPTKNL